MAMPPERVGPRRVRLGYRTARGHQECSEEAGEEVCEEARRPDHPRYAGERAGSAEGADPASWPAPHQGRPGRTRAGRRRPAGRVPHHGDRRPAARQRPLAQGRPAGPDAAAGPPPAGEDHPLRPRADPRARGPRARRGRPRRLRGLRHARTTCPSPASWPRASRRPSSCASPPCWAPGARPTRSATPAGSRRSSTPTRARSTWSATTSRSSSSRTASSSPT